MFLWRFVNGNSAVKRGDEGSLGWPTEVTPSYVVCKIGVSALACVQQRQFDQDSREDIVVNSAHPAYVDTDMSGHLGDLSPDQGTRLLMISIGILLIHCCSSSCRCCQLVGNVTAQC